MIKFEFSVCVQRHVTGALWDITFAGKFLVATTEVVSKST